MTDIVPFCSLTIWQTNGALVLMVKRDETDNSRTVDDFVVQNDEIPIQAVVSPVWWSEWWSVCNAITTWWTWKDETEQQAQNIN